MGASDPVLQAVCAVLVLAVPVALLMGLRPPGERRTLAVTVAGLVAAAGVIIGAAIRGGSVDPASIVLDAALAAAITGSVAVLAATRLGALGGGVFAAVWGVIVLPPVFAAVVGTVPSLVQTVFGAVDYAGVLATHVAPAASLFALSLLPARPRAAKPSEPARLSRAIVATVLLAVGATAWMVGVERVVNAATGRTLGNAVVGVLLGALVWALVARIAGRPGSPTGLVAGAVLGWAAIGAGVAFLSPVGLATAVVIGTASGTAVIVRAPAAADPVRRVAVGVIVAASVGGVVLALLADGFGLAATGAVAPVLGQLGAVLAIALGSAASGLLCGALAIGAIILLERGPRGRAAGDAVTRDPAGGD
ncbi:hypothetical protein [Microcella humidisoli]|uniref:Ammonium transporter n=1 Tax=Microcella humidisoli TaxID=2963406 RepID=A0ABY5FW67_9MICO|nr:hypothetical protein [Microcella humidisoli]UTT62396.1 hypothetical protein NNL39_12180 [Microcella humidisoli]